MGHSIKKLHLVKPELKVGYIFSGRFASAMVTFSLVSTERIRSCVNRDNMFLLLKIVWNRMHGSRQLEMHF